MTWVPKPDRFGSDAIIAGRVSDPDGFITEHRALEGLHGDITLYFSVAGLRQMAAKHPQVGLVSKKEFDDAWNLILGLKNKVLEAEARVAELEAFKASVAGITREDYHIRKPMGRPKEKV